VSVDTIQAPAAEEVVENRRIYVVREDRLDDARNIVGKANKKAARYGLPPYQLVVGELRMVELREPGRFPGMAGEVIGFEGVYDVEVVGEMPRYEGWSFVASLDYSEEGGVITRPVPGVEIDLSAHRARPAECDHCRKNRHRSATYVWRHADGRMMQVGSTCLIPFAGVRPPGLAWLDGDPLSDLSELSEESEGGGGGGGVRYLLVDEVLRVTMAVEQVEGWRSRAAARGFGKVATADLVLDYLVGTDKSSRAFQAHLKVEADWAAAEEKAGKVAAWVAEQDGTSEWAANLRTLVAGKHVGMRNVGLLASAVAGYNREVGERVEKAKLAEAVFIGQSKDRIDVDGEVVKTTRVANTFGYNAPDRELVLIRTETALLKWWSSSVTEFEVGDRVVGKATVKSHELYEGTRQTVILRAKLDKVEQN
jgi:hypothetical protein